MMLAFHSIYPPSHQCMNTSCKRSQQLMLKKAESRKAVLFTVEHGPIPVWSVHLVCEGMSRSTINGSIEKGWWDDLWTVCKINYHNNFRVFQGQRMYYDGIPDILQIGEHQFAETKLVELWITMMLLSWTSATNCARIYNMNFANSKWRPTNWQFSLEVTSEEVYDAFTVLSLLEECQLQSSTLVVPHGGQARDCFTTAIDIRNNRYRLSSQPELFHHCKKCMRYYPGMLILWISSNKHHKF